LQNESTPTRFSSAKIRIKLKHRQPDNQIVHRIVDELDDRMIVEQYLRHKPTAPSATQITPSNDKLIKLREHKHKRNHYHKQSHSIVLATATCPVNA